MISINTIIKDIESQCTSTLLPPDVLDDFKCLLEMSDREWNLRQRVGSVDAYILETEDKDYPLTLSVLCDNKLLRFRYKRKENTLNTAVHPLSRIMGVFSNVFREKNKRVVRIEFEDDATSYLIDIGFPFRDEQGAQFYSTLMDKIFK